MLDRDTNYRRINYKVHCVKVLRSIETIEIVLPAKRVAIFSRPNGNAKRVQRVANFGVQFAVRILLI